MTMHDDSGRPVVEGRVKQSLILAFLGTLVMGTTIPCLAAETVTYSYDTLGRLVASSHSGNVNSGLTIGITHDLADNRALLTVSGAAGGQRVMVLPLNGFTIIPLLQ